MADIFVNFVDSNNQTFIWGPNNSCDQGDYPQLLVPGLLDRSCGPRQATRLVVGGGGGECGLHVESQQRLRRRLTCGPRLILE